MRAYINIGSNLGDRMAHLERAVADVERAFGVIADRSQVVESDAWGFESDNSFLNVGIAFDTYIHPEQLLNQLLQIQNGIDASSHRGEDGGYADRAIDIDLIAVDEMVVESDKLTLPHPRMHLRRFVLVPMAELAPAWRHPTLGLTCVELLERNV